MKGDREWGDGEREGVKWDRDRGRIIMKRGKKEGGRGSTIYMYVQCKYKNEGSTLGAEASILFQRVSLTVQPRKDGS